MGDYGTNDPTKDMQGVPRRRLWRTCLLAGVLGAALALLLGFLFRDGLLRIWRGDNDTSNRFPSGVLADYVPEDSEAVLAVNVRTLRESPLGWQQLGPSVQQLLRQAERRLRWLDLLGLKPLDDLDSLNISFAPAIGGEPLWLARGRLDRSRIQTGPNKLHEATLDHFRVWEYVDRPAKQTTLLTPVGDMLIVSETRSRLLAALQQASDPWPVAVRDATLRQLLGQVDRQQSLWLAASIKSLGAIAGIDNYLLKLVLRPLLAHAESVYGGISCGEDVRAEFHFGASTDEDAARLETALQSICETAPGAALFLGRQKELLPLLRLLGAAKIRRDGKMILLRSRLTETQREE